ncbi:MAG TPA: hypothetical protein VIM61_09425 [Chthoniobacterales bacterium]|jgi:hypothetical protein
MSLATILRISLIASMILAVVGSLIDMAFPSLLSPFLQEHLKKQMEAEFSSKDIIFAILAIPLCILLLASYIGLFFWKNWARYLYLVLGVIAYFLSPFLGDQVYSGVAFTLYDLSTAIFGFILALLFFSPLVTRFTPKAEQGAAVNP